MKDFRKVALFMVFLGGMGQGILSPQIPELVGESGSVAWNSGLSASFLYAGIFFSSFIFGRWADQGKLKQLFLGGLLAYAFSLIGLSFSQALWSLFTLRLSEGISICAIFLGADYVLGRYSSLETRGKWLSFYGVALSLGLLTGPLVSLVAQRAGFSFALPLWILSSALLFTAVIVSDASFPKFEATGRPKPRLKNGPLGVGASYGFLESSLIALFPVLALNFFHLTPEWCLVITLVVAGAFSYPIGVWIDRGGARTVARASFLLLAIASGVLALWSRVNVGPGLAYLSCAVFGISAAALYPSGFAGLLLDVEPEDYGYASGSFSRFYGAGSLLGPFFTGVCTQLWGASGFYFVLAICGLFGVILVSLSWKSSDI